jgi:prophage tail gpP-like protein
VTDVWEPGDIVAVRDTVLGIDEPMVLVSTSANVSAESCTTELQLARAYAYTSEPIPDHSLIRKRPKKGIDTSWTS